MTVKLSAVCLFNGLYNRLGLPPNTAQPVYLQRIRVKFVYEGHRVNVKVTGAERIAHFRDHGRINHSGSLIPTQGRGPLLPLPATPFPPASRLLSAPLHFP